MFHDNLKNYHNTVLLFQHFYLILYRQVFKNITFRAEQNTSISRGVNRAGANGGRADFLSSGLARAERFYNSLEIRVGFLLSFTRKIKLTVIMHSCIVLQILLTESQKLTVHVNSIVSLMLCFSA